MTREPSMWSGIIGWAFIFATIGVGLLILELRERRKARRRRLRQMRSDLLEAVRHSRQWGAR